jgi:mannose-1-phosphate guanylyltransferase
MDMKERLTITLNSDTLEAIDKLIDGNAVKNRSHAIELTLDRALNNKPRKALLLLGGKGTRFRPITYEMPKALLPVQGRTVPEHLIDLFKKYGVTELVFSIGYLGDKVVEYFKDGSRFGVGISYVKEKEPLGSAGAIKLASSLLKDPFIVTNGDELKNINLEEMFQFHKRNKAAITVALTSVENPSAYGCARLEGNRVLEFIEKPPREKAPSNLVNSGLSIWDPEVLRYIPKGFSMYEKDLFPILARQGKLFGYVFAGQWFDTGTPERYEIAIKGWRGIG